MKTFHLRALAPLMMLVLALGLNTLAHARETAAQAANRQTIVAIYSKIDQLTMQKNVSAVMAWLAPDFRLYSSDGSSLDRAGYERLARTNMGYSALKIPLSKTTISKVEWRGPDAIVYSSSIVQMRGPNGTLVTTGQVRDYWGNAGKGWQLRQSVTLSGQVTLNGKVILRK